MRKPSPDIDNRGRVQEPYNKESVGPAQSYIYRRNAEQSPDLRPDNDFDINDATTPSPDDFSQPINSRPTAGPDNYSANSEETAINNPRPETKPYPDGREGAGLDPEPKLAQLEKGMQDLLQGSAKKSPNDSPESEPSEQKQDEKPAQDTISDEDFFYNSNAGKKIIDVDTEPEKEKDQSKGQETPAPTPKLNKAINAVSNTQKMVVAGAILTSIAGLAMLAVSLIFPISLPAATVVLTAGLATLAGSTIIGEVTKSILKRVRSAPGQNKTKGKGQEAGIEREKTNSKTKTKEAAAERESQPKNEKTNSYRFNPNVGFEKISQPKKKVDSEVAGPSSGFARAEKARRLNARNPSTYR